jgi:D-amino-acid dehydrogenase
LYAFGHQHVGWTLGGITGRIVADLALGKQPEVDITPFAARRFDATPWWRAFRAFA